MTIEWLIAMSLKNVRRSFQRTMTKCVRGETHVLPAMTHVLHALTHVLPAVTHVLHAVTHVLHLWLTPHLSALTPRLPVLSPRLLWLTPRLPWLTLLLSVLMPRLPVHTPANRCSRPASRYSRPACQYSRFMSMVTVTDRVLRSGEVSALHVSLVPNQERSSLGTTRSLHTRPGPFTSQPRSTRLPPRHQVTLGRGEPNGANHEHSGEEVGSNNTQKSMQARKP